VINNVVWTNSWLSIAGAGCDLICVGASEEWARKVYALQGLRGVKMQVGLTRGTRWPAGSSVGRMVARKASRSRRSEPVQGSSSQPKSTRGFEAVHHKTYRVTWLSHKTKTEGSRAERDRGAPRSFKAEDTHRDRKACVEATRRAVVRHLSNGATKTYSQSALGGRVSYLFSLGFP
jgi:hypothetical protein